jgi:cytochrome c oxidase subunit III
LANPAVLALREQFHSPEQQRETSTIGMWIFLITEVMLFGGLFTAFTVYRFSHPVGFDLGSADMEFAIGAINTAVLICSSFAMAMAVHSAELGKNGKLAIFLFLTIVIGLVFLALKFTEYYLHYRDQKLPGISFHDSSPHAPFVQMFFVFYFVMTGLHALHMIIGEGVLATMLLRTLLGSFSESYHTPVELAGLYWHFVDTVWVFLFAIFYIPGAHLR